MENIICVIVLSGKRHTGKDYIGLFIEKELGRLLGVNVKFVHATTEVKREFADHKKIDFSLLQIDRNYKETHRIEMTEYSTSQMKKYGRDYYNMLFKKNVLDKTSEPTIYIVDARFEFEIDYYHSLNLPIMLIRVNVDDEVRKKRGWVYDPIVDNDLSEIDLDNYKLWNFVFDNSEDGHENIIELINDKIVPVFITE